MNQHCPNYDTARERYHSAPIGSAEELDAFDEMTDAMLEDVTTNLTRRDCRVPAAGDE